MKIIERKKEQLATMSVVKNPAAETAGLRN